MLEGAFWFFGCGVLVLVSLGSVAHRTEGTSEFFDASVFALFLPLVSSALVCFVKGIQEVWQS